MTYKSERETILETCKLMQELGYFLGTWGNVSMRSGDAIILTPSRVDYDAMKLEDMVVIDIDGNKLEGERNATSEKEVHRQIYVARPELRAVVHAHTASCMAVSATETDEVPCITEEMSQLLGGSIPLTEEYVPAAEHEKLGAAAAAVIGEKSGVIMRNHGPVACGKDMAEAILVTKAMEKACGIYLMVAPHTPIRKIPQEYAESERYRFLHTYGKERT